MVKLKANLNRLQWLYNFIYLLFSTNYYSLLFYLLFFNYAVFYLFVKMNNLSICNELIDTLITRHRYFTLSMLLTLNYRQFLFPQ